MDKPTQIPNHYPDKVFKRTFLVDVTASVEFADSPFLENVEKLKPFFYENFGTTLNSGNFNNLDGIKLVSEDGTLKYHFTTKSASIIIKAEVYLNFRESLSSKIEYLVSFLNAMGVVEIESFKIIKRNKFPITTEDAYSVWPVALRESFQSNSIRSLANFPVGKDHPFTIEMDGSVKIDWGEIRTPFTMVVKDREHINFYLSLMAIAKSIKVKDIIEQSQIMNDAIFDLFTRLVSEKIISLMKTD